MSAKKDVNAKAGKSAIYMLLKQSKDHLQLTNYNLLLYKFIFDWMKNYTKFKCTHERRTLCFVLFFSKFYVRFCAAGSQNERLKQLSKSHCFVCGLSNKINIVGTLSIK